MGKRGPKPKSAEIESLQGFPGRRKAKTQAAMGCKALSAAPENDDIQDEPRDSRFVQPPQHLGKRERRVWVEIFSGPDASLWFKFSDHNVIARYCVLTVLWRQITKTPPKPTYTVTRITPGRSDKTSPILEAMIKRNPAFDQMLALSREMRSIEERIAGNPTSRLELQRKGLASGKEASPPPDGDMPASEKKGSGPIGFLKASHKMN